MKTLVVFSALAVVAIAAPTLHEETSEDLQKTNTKLPENLNRERKSPQEHTTTMFNPTPGAPVISPSTPLISEFGVSGRNIALKKPIIIKKNHGYHVYRDSDEEPAESGETCGKQVKVKLCDAKSDTMRSTTIEDFNLMTEEEMKHNIMLAKEAVENLQRDLMKIEKPGTKAVPWKHGHSESDAELHQDIEVAREALEHIHKNFGNLESMNLHATTLTDSSLSQNKESTNDKTDEQRLMQWKEAIEAIQKNAEIAKNIENSFRMTSGDNIMEHSNEQDKKTNQGMRATEEMETKNGKDCTDKPLHGMSSEQVNMNSAGAREGDVTSSASTISETNMKGPDDTHKEKSVSEGFSPTQAGNLKDKETEMETITLENMLQNVNKLTSDSMKTTEENKDRNGNEDRELKLAKMKSKESDSETEPHEALVKKLHNEDSMMAEKHDLDMKASENIDNLRNKEAKMQGNADHDKTSLLKSTESNSWVAQNKSNMKHENTLKKEHLVPHFTEAKIVHNGESINQVETTPNLENTMSHHHLNSFLHPEMRSADEMKNMHHHVQGHPSQRTWHEDNNSNFPTRMEFMKSADSAPSQTMNVAEKIQMPNHHLHHAINSHHIGSGHGHQHSRFSDFMLQGKSASNMDMQPYYMSARDGMNMAPESHRFQWEPNHENMRVAFGSSAAPAAQISTSSGSSGSNYPNAIFPDANVGNCAVPLLLSCNPQVVSGIMAKSKAYSAPSYRSEDDFNFHMKRDARKAHEIPSTTLHKTPSNVNLKTSTVLVAKQ